MDLNVGRLTKEQRNKMKMAEFCFFRADAG